MSGHSKWKNIMHKKEKTDAQKAKVFTKIGKEIAVAVKAGGSDPASNSKLKELIAKAKANNVPNDNIDRIIKKSSDAASANIEEITYEGYGPCGVAVIVETATDNRNRTGGDVRHYFDKFGGNLGQSGCVSFMFEDKGVIIVTRESGADEDSLMEAALEAGASDFEASEDIFEIYTEVSDLWDVRDAIAAAGFTIESADTDKIPSTYVTIDNEDDLKAMNKMLEHFEEHDDVIEVYHNCENAGE